MIYGLPSFNFEMIMKGRDELSSICQERMKDGFDRRGEHAPMCCKGIWQPETGKEP